MAPAIAPDATLRQPRSRLFQWPDLAGRSITVLDDPAILCSSYRIDGAVEAAAIYGCSHPTIQQGSTEKRRRGTEGLSAHRGQIQPPDSFRLLRRPLS